MVNKPKPTVEEQILTPHRTVLLFNALRAAGIDPATVTVTAKPTTVPPSNVKKGVRNAS
jgi:hypothetical protein